LPGDLVGMQDDAVDKLVAEGDISAVLEVQLGVDEGGDPSEMVKKVMSSGHQFNSRA